MGSHTSPRTSSVVPPTSDALAFTDDFEPTKCLYFDMGDLEMWEDKRRRGALHRFASKGVASELVHLVS